MPRVTILLLPLLAACGADAPPVDGVSQDTGVEVIPGVTYTWADNSFTVTVDGVEGETYRFGLTETEHPQPGLDPRTGEDCANSDAFCHEIAEGQPTALLYGGDPDAPRQGATAFDRETNDGLTFILRTDRFTECWVWGQQVTLYAGQGCVTLEGN